MLETKGYRGGDAQVKAETMRTLWVPGVNNLGTFGRWQFEEFTDVFEIEAAFGAADGQLVRKGAGMDELPQFGRLEEASFARPGHTRPTTSHHGLADNLDRIADAIGVSWSWRIPRWRSSDLRRTSWHATRVESLCSLRTSSRREITYTSVKFFTYLAGLEAETVIWVASSFREAHLSAIRWLNEHTEEPYSFFALKVGVVQMTALRRLHRFSRSWTGRRLGSPAPAARWTCSRSLFPKRQAHAVFSISLRAIRLRRCW